MSLDYETLVVNLLSRDQYPVLTGPVLVEIFYATIPQDHPSESIRVFDGRVQKPQDVYERESDPWNYSFLVGNGESFQLHACESIDDAHFTTECRRVKLTRGIVDAVLQTSSEHFERELCRFVGCVNFDLPKVAPLLDLTFQESTRFLPRRIRTIATRFEAVRLRPVDKEMFPHFGPKDDGVLPVRVVRGRLAPCTSTSSLLSLNDDIAGAPHTYVDHLVPSRKAIATLAYNPLENPIM